MVVDSCDLTIHFLVTGGEILVCKKAPKLAADLPRLNILLQTEGITVRTLRPTLSDMIKSQFLPSQEKRIQKREMKI